MVKYDTYRWTEHNPYALIDYRTEDYKILNSFKDIDTYMGMSGYDKAIVFSVEDLNRMNSPAAIATLLKEKLEAEEAERKANDPNEIAKRIQEEETPDPELVPGDGINSDDELEKTYDPKNPRIEKGMPTPKTGKHSVKWVNGRTYKLRFKSKCGLRGYEKKYVLKKFIYTINQDVVNIVIMKQIGGPVSTIFTLNREECRQFHLKYEEGLQVMPMSFNWIPYNET